MRCKGGLRSSAMFFEFCALCAFFAALPSAASKERSTSAREPEKQPFDGADSRSGCGIGGRTARALLPFEIADDSLLRSAAGHLQDLEIHELLFRHALLERSRARMKARIPTALVQGQLPAHARISFSGTTEIFGHRRVCCDSERVIPDQEYGNCTLPLHMRFDLNAS
jgi:hypothetical protein